MQRILDSNSVQQFLIFFFFYIHKDVYIDKYLSEISRLDDQGSSQ